MTLDNLIHLIKSTNYLFEVIPEGGTSYGKQNRTQVDEIHGSIENYLKKIANAKGLKTLTVSLYAKNGSSLKRKDVVNIEIPEINTNSNESNNGSNNGKASQIKYTKDMNHSEIEAVQLKTENKYLSEKVDELKARNKELERKNDEYYNENLRLTREHATEKDKRDLEYKQKELDLLAKQKQGLSGIMEEVKTMPPEAWQFIAGLLPNHPMSKGLLPPANNDNALNGTVKHNDPDAQACIEVMDSLLLKQSSEIVGMVAMLTEHLVTHPTVLKAVYDKFFPETKDNSNNSSNNDKK